MNNKRPNVYELYENEIGMLTPMIADVLADALSEYPEDWFAPAIRIAVERNVRNWRYIEAVLKRWKIEGFQSKGRGNGSGQALTAEEERQQRQDKLVASLRKYGVET